MSGDKWTIQKCRRGRSCWHVAAPCPDIEGDEWDNYCPDWEFRSGAEAIAFVDKELRNLA